MLNAKHIINIYNYFTLKPQAFISETIICFREIL